MRVLFWSEQFWPNIGGVEVWSAKLLCALREHGHDFIVVTSQDASALAQEDRYQGIPVRRFPFWTALTSRDARRLIEIKREVARLKQRFQPDLVHLNLSGASVYFHVQTADTYRTPLLVSLHQPLEHQSGGSDSIVGRVLRSADWTTAGSTMVLTTALRLVPEISSRSSVNYFGFDTPDLSPESLPFEAPRLLCLGRHVYDKGFDLALTAFSTIARRFSHARLIMASDGPARPALEQQAAELGIAHLVDFIGWVEFDKIPALLNSATMVLMPSRGIEGFGLVAMEAAVMGRPVVATRNGGLSEVVVDGQTGLIVESENSAELARAIEYLIDHPDITAMMGRAARSRAQALFGWERHVKAFDDLYRQLHNGFPHASF
ncbi:MAG TPA: glycosyltransferase family 4 protein [Candidatus Binatia bacterium]|jgi:glycogen(starch) synthase